ncbi:hypothetical protein D3C80_2001060 [compost metagenome]
MPGAVIGDLAAAINLHHRDVSRCEQMFGLASLTLSKYPGVLQQPDFVRCPFVALGSQASHRFEGRQIVHQPQMAHDKFGRCH